MFQSFISKIQLSMSYYAVAKGRNPGVYRTWDECKSQVDKFPRAVYKKFSSLAEANLFIDERKDSLTQKISSRSYSRKNNEPYTLPVQSSYHKQKENKTMKIDSYFSNNLSTSSSKCFVNSTIMKNTIIRGSEDFQRDSEGRVDIYTDGACSSNGTANAKAGLGVYFGDNHPANVSKPVRGRATNNNAEIQAVTEAAKIAQKNGLSKIRINTDSEFLINCMTKWMKRWKSRGWKTTKNQAVLNKKELVEMEQALAPLDVEFNHIRGHVGIHGNEMADKLAREGAKM